MMRRVAEASVLATVLATVLAFFVAPALARVTFGANDVQTIFFISKSDDRNRVDYGVRLDDACLPVGARPVFAYWRRFEPRQARLGELNPMDRRAYGIQSQSVRSRADNGSWIEMRLRGFPRERFLVLVQRGTESACHARAQVRIDQHDAFLHHIHIELEGPMRIDRVVLEGRDVQTGAALRESRPRQPRGVRDDARPDDSPGSFGSPDVDDSTTPLSAADIQGVVARERASIMRCYETAARATDRAPGLRLDVDFTVAASGRVTSAEVRGQTFGDLAQCVARNVRRWRFRVSSGETRTSVPFVFQGRADEPADDVPSEPVRRAPTGPTTPSRSDIVLAMNSVSGPVQACGDGEHRLAQVRLVFAGGDGRVVSATVSGDTFSDSVRTCIARAARGARVPPFRQDDYSVNYPFRL